MIQIVEKYNVLEAELEMIKKHIELIIQNRIKQNYEMVHEICQYVQMFLNQKANLNDPKNIIIDTSEDDFDDSISDIHPKNTNSLIKSHSDNIKNPLFRISDLIYSNISLCLSVILPYAIKLSSPNGSNLISISYLANISLFYLIKV